MKFRRRRQKVWWASTNHVGVTQVSSDLDPTAVQAFPLQLNQPEVESGMLQKYSDEYRIRRIVGDVVIAPRVFGDCTPGSGGVFTPFASTVTVTWGLVNLRGEPSSSAEGTVYTLNDLSDWSPELDQTTNKSWIFRRREMFVATFPSFETGSCQIPVAFVPPTNQLAIPRGSFLDIKGNRRVRQQEVLCIVFSARASGWSATPSGAIYGSWDLRVLVSR